MKKLQSQLKLISKSLVSLSKQVGKVADRLNKLQTSKTTSSVKKKKKATVKSKPAAKKATAKSKPAAKKATVKSKSSAKKAKTSKTKKTPAKEKTVLDIVFEAIKRSRNGVSIDKLKEKTGLVSRQLSNALYKLAKKGNIKSKGRGLYVKK